MIVTEQDGCSHEDLMRFDNLLYKNKIAFTTKKYSDIRCSYAAEGYENQKEVRMLLDFKNRYSIHRNYDFFDFVRWFNCGEI